MDISFMMRRAAYKDSDDQESSSDAEVGTAEHPRNEALTDDGMDIDNQNSADNERNNDAEDNIEVGNNDQVDAGHHLEVGDELDNEMDEGNGDEVAINEMDVDHAGMAEQPSERRPEKRVSTLELGTMSSTPPSGSLSSSRSSSADVGIVRRPSKFITVQQQSRSIPLRITRPKQTAGCIPVDPIRRIAKLGEKDPAVLTIRCHYIYGGQKVLKFQYMAHSEINWNNPAHIKTINKWSYGVYGRAGIYHVPFSKWHSDQDLFIYAYALLILKEVERSPFRVSFPRFGQFSEDFNRFFEGRVLKDRNGVDMAPCVPRTAETFMIRSRSMLKELKSYVMRLNKYKESPRIFYCVDMTWEALEAIKALDRDWPYEIHAGLFTQILTGLPEVEVRYCDQDPSEPRVRNGHVILHVKLNDKVVGAEAPVSAHGGGTGDYSELRRASIEEHGELDPHGMAIEENYDGDLDGEWEYSSSYEGNA